MSGLDPSTWIDLAMSVVIASSTVVLAILAHKTWLVYRQMADLMVKAPQREWMPLLDIQEGEERFARDGVLKIYDLVNLGRSHATDVVVKSMKDEHAVAFPAVSTIGPGETIRFEVSLGPNPMVGTLNVSLAVSFGDLFGNKFSIVKDETKLRYFFYSET